jgi:hypothetical protein
MSGYDWSKVKQYPPLGEQMQELIAWANHRAEEEREPDGKEQNANAEES